MSQSQQSPLSPAPIVEINSFLVYLKRLISVLLDEDGEKSDDLDKALNDKANVELFKKFLSDFSVKCLQITKTSGILKVSPKTEKNLPFPENPA